MRVGVCLCMTMEQPRQRDLFLAWCEAADRSPLSTIGLGDRFAHESQEPLIALAFAAGATKRVSLMSSVVALPTRNVAVVAKEVASLDVLSGGRFTLGVGVSSRPDDLRSAGVPWEGRAKCFEKQIRELRSIWAGEAPADNAPPIGPRPLTRGGPEIIVGAVTDLGLRRAGRIGDGIMSWTFRPDPEGQQRSIRIAEEAWRKAGRAGRPKIIGSMYFALGPHAKDLMRSYFDFYYAYSDHLHEMALTTQTFTRQAIRETIASYAEVGVDEILFATVDPGIDQVERLAELVP